MKPVVIGVAVALAAAAAGWIMLSPGHDHAEARWDAAARGPVVDVAALTADAQRGRLAFNARCADCHGADALGGAGGPPLIHKIYEPSHHGDGAFYNAVRNGVAQHHWDFGHMPPQRGVTQAEVALIVTYVRQAQRQNGIN